MRPLRVAFLIPGLSGGGAERATAALAGFLNQDRFEVCLVLERDTPALYEVPLGIKLVSLRAVKTRGALRPLIKFLRDWKPDILYSALPHLNVLAVIASKLSLVSPKTVVSVHNNQKFELAAVQDGWLLKILMPLVYKLCDAVVVVSEGIKEELIISGVALTKLHVIYNPIDLNQISILSKEPVHHKWFDGSHSVVMAMGRLVSQKNYNLLLQSFLIIHKALPKARLIILGEGELLHELLKLRAWLELDDVVDFVGVQVNPFSWLAKASCFVLTSEYEGFGMVLVEAMAVGVPVVSVDCKYGPAEILENGSKGMLVNDNTPKSVSAAILGVLDNPDLASSLIQKGLGRASDFDVHIPVRQLEKLFEGFFGFDP